MDFTSVKVTPKTPRATKVEISHPNQLNLSLYLDPPSEEVTVLEIEELVSERLKVLKIVERLKERHNFLTPNFKAAFDKEINAYNTYKAWSSTKAEFHRRRDLISHFVLRLACSTSVDLTQRFITRELDLFKIRFTYLTLEQKIQFFEENDIKLNEVDTKEREQFRSEIMNANRLTPDAFASSTFYKLYFTDCRELVRSRKVFLNAGYCYVTINDLVQFLAQKFRLVLSTSMNKQRTQMGTLDEDDRLLAMLHRLVYDGTRTDEPMSASSITPEQVDQLARTSFPLCMRRIHSQMRSDHHLRYFARQQYGLFLKGAGMSLEGSVAFFRQEFTKKMDIDKFDKNYLYNIRHMYGKEGNRVDHKPQNCASIILGNPPNQSDCHGCPFRHVDTKTLEQQLQNMKISKDRVDKIVQMTKEHRYDMACTKVFECTHDMAEDDLGRIITSPNEYFNLSCDIRDGKRSKTNGFTQTFSSQNHILHSQSQQV